MWKPVIYDRWWIVGRWQQWFNKQLSSVSVHLWVFNLRWRRKKKLKKYFFLFYLFFLHSKADRFRSIFRGGKELCCWADQVSTNIRELLINHACSTQQDAAGFMVFVCLGAHTCVPASINPTVSRNLRLRRTFKLFTLGWKKKKSLCVSCVLQPQATSSISYAPLVASVS